LTYIYDTPEKADTFFPEIDESEWVETFREEHEVDEKHAYRYAFVDLERKTVDN
jgi:dihydrofolate reductase